MEQKFNKWTQLLNCKELNGNERIVLTLILNYHNIDNWNNTSLRTLKKDCGMAINTIKKHIKALEDKGLIKTVISSYKKSFNATNDYLPNYEAIQEMIDGHVSKHVSNDMEHVSKHVSNHVSNDMEHVSNFDIEHVSKIDNKDNIIYNTIKENKKEKREKEKRKEKPENPVNGNQESNFSFDSVFTDNPNNLNQEKENPENPVIENQESNYFSFDSVFMDFTDSPSNLNQENEESENPIWDSQDSISVFEINNNNNQSKLTMNKSYNVNLNYIDSLEQQFNGYSNATSPKATTTPKAKRKYAPANPNLTPEYVRSLNCLFPEENPSILNDLIEAAKQPTLVMDAMDRAIEWTQRHKNCKDKDMDYIAQVYANAKPNINPTNAYVFEVLKTEIVKYGDEEDLKIAQIAQ